MSNDDVKLLTMERAIADGVSAATLRHVANYQRRRGSAADRGVIANNLDALADRLSTANDNAPRARRARVPAQGGKVE